MGTSGSRSFLLTVGFAFALAAFARADVQKPVRTEPQPRPAEAKAKGPQDTIRSLRLANDAASFIKTKPDLALLLAIEANEADETPEARGALLEALQAHPQIVRYVHGQVGWLENIAFAAGGLMVLRGRAGKGTIGFWDPGTGRPDGAPVELGDNPSALAVSPDGRTFAAVAGERLHLIDVKTRKPVRPLTEFKGWVDNLVFGPGGVLAGETGWGEISLWDAMTGKLITAPVQAHDERVEMDAGGVFVSPAGAASWTPPASGLPEECSVSSVVARGRLLFLSTEGGVFKSADKGRTWSEAGSFGPEDSYVRCLAAKGKDLFAGTDTSEVIFFEGEPPPSGVFLSRDGGASWKPAGAGIPAADVRALFVNGPDLYAGTDRGVFLSSDSGASWRAASMGMTEADVYGLAALGPRVFAGTGGGGVFMSVDKGAGWTAVNSGLKNKDVRALAVMGSILFAGTDGGGVYLSADGGGSWVEVNSGLLDSYVRSLAVSGSRLFAGTRGGVFATATHGAVWTAFSDGLPASTDVACLAAIGDTLFAGTEGGGSNRSNDISKLVFSPDGATLVSGAEDGTVRRFSAKDLSPSGVSVMAHREGVAGLAFHPEGKILASSGASGEFRLWRWPDMKPLAGPVAPHSGEVRLAYTPDGVLLTIGNAANICRWDGRTLEEIGKPIPTCQDRPGALAVRSDGLVATGGADGTVILWDLETPSRLLTRLRAHAENGAAFADPGLLLAAGENGVLRYWSWPAGRLLREVYAAAGQGFNRIEAASTGRFAVGLDNGMIQLSDPKAGRLQAPVHALNGLTHGLSFSPDGTKLAACDYIPGTLCVIDAATGVLTAPPLNAGVGNIWDGAISPDGKVVAVVGERGLRLFDSRDLRPLAGPLAVPGGSMFFLTFLPDGRLAVTGSDKSTKECLIQIRDGTTGKLSGPEIRGPAVCGLLSLPETNVLAAGSYDGEVRLWDLGTRRSIGVLQGLTNDVTRHLSLGPSGRLVVALDNGSVEVWDIDPASWKALARSIANRSLTAEERARFLDAAPSDGGIR